MTDAKPDLICRNCVQVTTNNPSEMSAEALGVGAAAEVIGVKLCPTHAQLSDERDALKAEVERLKVSADVQWQDKQRLLNNAEREHDDLKAQAQALREALSLYERSVRCHAGKDGQCNWKHCPQTLDSEPSKSGRHCPFDKPEHYAEL